MLKLLSICYEQEHDRAAVSLTFHNTLIYIVQLMLCATGENDVRGVLL